MRAAAELRMPVASGLPLRSPIHKNGAMIPLKETYRGVDIRYGYSIQDDLIHAHFDAPTREREADFQTTVGIELAPVLSAPKPHIRASTEADALEQARALIDRYLDS